MIELYEKTLGVIGYGRIGKSTAKIAEAMGMKILAYDSNFIREEDTAELVSLDDLLCRSDVIHLEVP